LLGNALKFRARQRPLQVTIESRDTAKMVELSVEDNGLGMDAETAEHALEPLYRGRMDREVPGHGLGLAIVDRTVRALGGSCELTSELDRGTKITVQLPRV
jgi:signal transduction histidine kinase